MDCKIVHRLAVKLDGSETIPFVTNKVFGQHSHTGTYLDKTPTTPRQAAGYAFGDTLVRQEMLP